MGDFQKRGRTEHDHTSAMGRRLRIVPKRDRKPECRLWSSIGQAKAAAVVLCVLLTEAANFIPNDDNAWTWYLTTSELTKAALSLFLPIKWVRWSACGIFASQALDELTGGNYFGAGLWEYPLSAVFVLVVYLLTRSHDTKGGS